MQNNEIAFIIFILTATFLIILLIGFIVSMLFINQKRLLNIQAQMDNLKLNHEKDMLKTQLEIQEQTFHDISREIHDNIGLSLTLVKLNLNTIHFGNRNEATEKVHSSVELISKAIIELNDISKSLSSEIINEQGLLKAIEMEVNKLKMTGMYTVEHHISGTPVFMEATKELILLRIVQECLNNIIKHAKANRIVVEQHYDGHQMFLAIADNGTGFAWEDVQQKRKKKAMAGLLNIRERSQLVNGTCDIDSKPGAGTHIKISVPY